jgi:hypothetical protein
MVYIRSYRKSVLRYKFLSPYTHHPDTLYLHEEECEYLWLFFEAKRDARANLLENTALSDSMDICVRVIS